MAHPDQLKFVRFWSRSLPGFFRGVRVLEVGSLDINGSVRPFFSEAEYLGIDLGEGPGVDRVVGGHEFDAPDASFDVVISCECMEHNPFWAETIENMIRLLRPGGLLLMSFAGYGRPVHGIVDEYPAASPLTIGMGWNYYRNLGRSEMAAIPALREAFFPLFFGENASFCDFYVAGIKRSSGPVAGSPPSTAEAETITGFRYAERRVRRWLRRKNRGWRARSRLFAARLAGERGVRHCLQIQRWFDPDMKLPAEKLPPPAKRPGGTPRSLCHRPRSRKDFDDSELEGLHDTGTVGSPREPTVPTNSRM